MSSSSLPLQLVAGNAHPALAEQVARVLNISTIPLEMRAFADGETSVHVASDVRGATVFILQPTCPPVNDHLMALVLAVDALRAAGAARVIGIVPYFGYARQDLRANVGDARSAQVVGKLLSSVGLDHLVTLDLHSPALESALPMPTTLLRSEELFLPRIQEWRLDRLVVVSPDAGGIKRAQRFAQALSAPLAIAAKQRPKADVAVTVQVLGDVKQRACLIVDDMASTGRTLCNCAEALMNAGAAEIHAIFTHAVLAPGALERLLAAPIGRLVTSDSIPVTPTARVEVISLAPLLARTVRYLAGERDVTPSVSRTGQGA